MDFRTLKKNLKQDFSQHRVVRLALLGDTATQFLHQALRGYGYSVGLNYEVFEADYDQIERQLLDPNSEYHAFKADFTVLYMSSEKLIQKFYDTPVADRPHFAQKQLDKLRGLAEAVPGKLICFNFSEINDSVFGNFANKTTISFLYQVRKLNVGLMDLSQELKHLFIHDLAALERQFGAPNTINQQFFINSALALSLDFIPAVAKNITDIVLSILGTFKKCLILDLDNTTWGGIIGDDGVENIQVGELGIGKAFTNLQRWAKELERRGIILAVCSKNDDKIAREPFEKHPEMVLRLDDIAAFVANWENKADNIRQIQRVLNIGFDSMVFLDDNPFERNMVRENVPGVTVPELPEDPTEYVPFLRSLNLFETATYSENDAGRTSQYQVEAKRAIAQQSFTNEADFLKNLEMVCTVTDFNKFNIPRVAQLTQRSNQFNLRTVRYTEGDVLSMSQSAEFVTFAFSLKDKFGDYGLISAVVLQKEANQNLFIDTWIMSCRVLKRGMERFVLDVLVTYARENGFTQLTGEYLPTPKNGLVRDHYAGLGFEQQGNRWVLPVANYYKEDFFIAKA